MLSVQWVAVSRTRKFRLWSLVICGLEALLNYDKRTPQLVGHPGRVFFINPGARDLLSIPALCDLTVSQELL